MNNENVNTDILTISSSHSLRVSLEGVSSGRAGLDNRRTAILNRIPDSGNWANFPKDSITTKDLAYLSAKTDEEFALLRGKKSDIVFHGVHTHCTFDDELKDMLKEGKLRLVAHSHPDVGQIIPSDDDRKLLEIINQQESIIVSWVTGAEITFTQSIFDK